MKYLILAAMAVHVVLILACVWKVWAGENIIDRIISVDVIGLLFSALLVLLSLYRKNALYMDLALALIALGGIGTLAFAKLVQHKNTPTEDSNRNGN